MGAPLSYLRQHHEDRAGINTPVLDLSTDTGVRAGTRSPQPQHPGIPHDQGHDHKRKLQQVLGIFSFVITPSAVRSSRLLAAVDFQCQLGH